MRWVSGLAVLCLTLGALLSGTGAYGRLLLSLGQPAMAARVFADPPWQAVAHYRAGAMPEAAALWLEQSDHYNRGNALVATQSYAAALEAYDLAITLGHADAAANFDLVARFYAGLGLGADALALLPKRETGPTMESSIAQGDGRAAGSGTETTNANTMLGLAELDSHGRLGVRRVFDETFVIADDRWLRQLEDVPGAFLAARIAHAHKARLKAGTAPPDPEDPK